jgi:anti-sigma28 factor (negative regulator of flagellin synthesis)
MLQQVLTSPEPFDAQKVEELRELLAKGGYKVDIPTLAEKLTDEIIRGSGS